MIESVRAAFTLPDLRRRIFFTIGMLIIYRLVANIPVPGVDLQSWLLSVPSVPRRSGHESARSALQSTRLLERFGARR